MTVKTSDRARRAKDRLYAVLPIAQVKDDPNNENVHTEEQLLLLRASIRSYGQIEDVLIDRNNMCIAGHGIKQAMALENAKTISCKYSDLAGARRSGYRIAANQLARMSFFDQSVLELNIRNISKEMGKAFDPELIAMTQAELDLILGGNTWKAKTIDPNTIGEYDPAAETFTIRIDGVKAADKENIMTRISRALKGTGYEQHSY